MAGRVFAAGLMPRGGKVFSICRLYGFPAKHCPDFISKILEFFWPAGGFAGVPVLSELKY